MISAICLLAGCTSSNFDEYQHSILSEIAVDVADSIQYCGNTEKSYDQVLNIHRKTRYLTLYSVGDKKFHKAVNELKALLKEMKTRYQKEKAPSIGYCREKLEIILISTSRILNSSRGRGR